MSVEPHAGVGSEGLSGIVTTPSSTLVLLPPYHDHDADVCLDLLTVDSPADEDVLSITYDEPPAATFDRWDDRIGVFPASFHIVAVDAPVRSVDADSSKAPSTTQGTDVTTHTIAEPDDLGALGTAIADQLSKWEDSPRRTVLCFRSLTTLCEYVERRRLFRFLHALCHRLESADVVSHFHLDPNAVDELTLYTLAPLFDNVVETDESGSVRVADGDQFSRRY